MAVGLDGNECHLGNFAGGRSGNTSLNSLDCLAARELGNLGGDLLTGSIEVMENGVTDVLKLAVRILVVNRLRLLHRSGDGADVLDVRGGLGLERGNGLAVVLDVHDDVDHKLGSGTGRIGEHKGSLWLHERLTATDRAPKVATWGRRASVVGEAGPVGVPHSLMTGGVGGVGIVCNEVRVNHELVFAIGGESGVAGGGHRRDGVNEIGDGTGTSQLERRKKALTSGVLSEKRVTAPTKGRAGIRNFDGVGNHTVVEVLRVEIGPGKQASLPVSKVGGHSLQGGADGTRTVHEAMSVRDDIGHHLDHGDRAGTGRNGKAGTEGLFKRGPTLSIRDVSTVEGGMKGVDVSVKEFGSYTAQSQGRLRRSSSGASAPAALLLGLLAQEEGVDALF